MSSYNENENKSLKRLVQRNLFFYLCTNIFFNTFIPYSSLRDLDRVYLFEGEFCFARFILPMALLLPFIITFDIMKKTIALIEDGRVGFILPEGFVKNRFIFKMAGINGSLSFLFIFLTMLGLHFFLPGNYGFNGTLLSFLSGGLAGTLSIVFTLLPVRKLMKFSNGINAVQ